MTLRSGQSGGALLTAAGFALHKSQGEIGQLIGVSRRTVSRRLASGGSLYRSEAFALARAIHPVDPELAARLASHVGETLESLGITQRVAAKPPQPTRAELEVIARTQVEAVVCAAAEALDASPRAVRPALLAAFGRARALGLSLEMAETILSASLLRPRPVKRRT